MSSAPETPTPESGTPSPGPETINKFNFLRKAKSARSNPFVNPRPSLTRDSSTAELFSRENSSGDFFQNSRLNLFETAPKPEASAASYNKVKITFL